MKKFGLVVLALATALATAPAAMASSFYISFSGPSENNAALHTGYTGGPAISGSGYIDGINEGGGVFDITNGILSVTITGYGTYTATIVGNPSYPSAPAWPGVSGTSYDDQLTPGASPYVNTNGLLFSLSSGVGGNSLNGQDFAIWYATGISPLSPSYVYNNQDVWDVESLSKVQLINDGSAGGDPLTFNDVNPTPEPSSLLLLGTGLLLMAGFLFRQKALQGVL